jgi:uncharacterized membrane protein
MMNKLQSLVIGRIFIGVGIAGIGLVHFLLPGLRPVMAPIPPESVWPMTNYFVGTMLLAGALAILCNKEVGMVSLSLAGLFVLFFLFGHLPNRLKYHPEILGYWTDAIKLLSLTGGALVLASLSIQKSGASPFLTGVQQFGKNGKYLFALMLTIFGIDHFLLAELVGNMVPAWIPFHLFWTYFTGSALIAAGLAIFLSIKVKLAMNLLILMLMLWFVLLHVPATIQYPLGDGGSLISSFEVVYFSGTALLLVADETKF